MEAAVEVSNAQAVWESNLPVHSLRDLAARGQYVCLASIEFGRTNPPVVRHVAIRPKDQEVLNNFLGGYISRHLPPTDVKGEVLFGIHETGKIDVATWSPGNPPSPELGNWATQLMKDLPVAPFQTWFGWGNNGKPKKMDVARLEKLTPKEQQFVDRVTHPEAT